MKMKTAIFDLDGTLLNTLGDLCDSVNCAIVPRGFPAVDEELTRQRVGNGVRRLVERCIPEEKRTEAMIGRMPRRFPHGIQRAHDEPHAAV